MGIEYDVLFGGKKLSCGSGQLSADDVAADGQHTHISGAANIRKFYAAAGSLTRLILLKAS